MHSDRDNSSGETSPPASSNKHPHPNGAHIASAMKLWRCPNCGQSYFGTTAPDMCDFCCDFTTWQLMNAEPNAAPEAETPAAGANHTAHATQELNIQLRLIPDEDEYVD